MSRRAVKAKASKWIGKKKPVCRGEEYLGPSGEKTKKGRPEKKYDRRDMRRMYHKLDNKTMAHWGSSTSSRRHSLLQTLGPCMNIKGNGTGSSELETTTHLKRGSGPSGHGIDSFSGGLPVPPTGTAILRESLHLLATNKVTENNRE